MSLCINSVSAFTACMHDMLSAARGKVLDVGGGGGGGGVGGRGLAAYLDETPHRFAISRHNVLLVSMHNLIPLSSGQIVLRQVQIDFISIKVSIECVAVGIVHTDDSLALHKKV